MFRCKSEVLAVQNVRVVFKLISVPTVVTNKVTEGLI